MRTHTLPSKRFFVALPISKTLQEEILRWEMAYTKFPVRWLTGKNLHVTLIPPWHAEDDTEAKELLADVPISAPFPLAFRRVSFGPDPAKPRLIWAEGPTPPELVALRDALAAALGQEPERRPFRLHLTLARFAKAPARRARFAKAPARRARFREELFSSFPTQKLNERVEWRDTARSFVLMESHLSPRGADYEVRAELPLRRA